MFSAVSELGVMLLRLHSGTQQSQQLYLNVWKGAKMRKLEVVIIAVIVIAIVGLVVFYVTDGNIERSEEEVSNRFRKEIIEAYANEFNLVVDNERYEENKFGMISYSMSFGNSTRRKPKSEKIEDTFNIIKDHQEYTDDYRNWWENHAIRKSCIYSGSNMIIEFLGHYEYITIPMHETQINPHWSLGQAKQIIPEGAEFRIIKDNEIKVLEDSFDGENIYYQESTEEHLSDVYIHNIRKGESRLVLESISDTSGMSVSDGHIVGWKPVDEEHEAVFIYNIETREMKTLEPYGKDVHQQINGFTDGRLLFRKTYIQEGISGKKETLHIYDNQTDEEIQIAEDDEVGFPTSALRFNGRYVLFMRNSRFDGRPKPRHTTFEIYDVGAGRWLDVDMDADPYYIDPIMTNDHLVWNCYDCVDRDYAKGRVAMAYHIPTKKTFRLNDIEYSVSKLMSKEGNSVYYYIVDIDDGIMSSPTLIKAILNDDMVLDEFAIFPDNIAQLIIPMGDWLVLQLNTNEERYLYNVYHLEGKSMFTLSFEEDDIAFDLKASKKSIFQSHGDDLLVVTHPDSDKTGITGVVYSLK